AVGTPSQLAESVFERIRQMPYVSPGCNRSHVPVGERVRMAWRREPFGLSGHGNCGHQPENDKQEKRENDARRYLRTVLQQNRTCSVSHGLSPDLDFEWTNKAYDVRPAV